jgi:hypothetical protein
LIIYGLYGASFMLGITSIVAIVLNYIKRDSVAGTVYASHFSWQIRTFWIEVARAYPATRPIQLQVRPLDDSWIPQAGEPLDRTRASAASAPMKCARSAPPKSPDCSKHR